MISPPSVPATPYTSFYCEENIYLLAQSYLEDYKIRGKWDVYVVFISNGIKQAISSSQLIQ